MTNDPNQGQGLRCARCGKEKRRDDTWFAVRETKGAGGGRGLVIEPLTGALESGQEPLCSERCVLERVGSFIARRAQAGQS
jgi:hypothetical protein